MSKETFSSPPGGFPDAKTPSETLRKRNGSFPSVKSDSPTPQRAPGGSNPRFGNVKRIVFKPGRLKPPFRECQKNRFQALPGAFLTPKRLPKRCENATVRSQVSNLISPLPGRPPGGSTPRFGDVKRIVFKPSRGLS